jgi:hypothetical protein
MFTDAVHDQLQGREIGPARWLRPVLSIEIRGRGGAYLTFILESPGPFCFLSERDPLQGAPAPARFPQLEGATITGLVRPAGERVLRVEVRCPGEAAAAVALNAMMFGSAGRVELLRRDGTPVQYVGGRLKSPPGRARRREAAPASGPFYLLSRHRLGRVAPSPSDDPAAAHRLGPFPDAVAACARVGGLILAAAQDRIVRSRMKPLVRRIETRRKLLEKLLAERERAEDHQSERRQAEILAAYQSSIRPGARAVELPDPYESGRSVRIELDPSLPIRSQIERRFKRAAKLERSLVHRQRRIDEVRREIESLERTAAAVDRAPDFGAAMAHIERLARDHGWFGPSGRSAEAGRPDQKAVAHEGPFRRYDLDDTWFVLVGRNNRENDELTFHAASPTDLWFHAQNVAGSHAVLKSRGSPGAPPAHILEAAAAIAAHFSKSKHSGLAPVVYTQRKYVRKFRGAKPGQVVCEREKMIMVAPGLPHTPPR